MKKVLFHTGRGGRFYNAGYKTCKGLIDNFDPEYYGINIYLEENPTDESSVTLDNGETACTYGELNADTGTFNIDNDYDSYNWLPIADLDEKDFNILTRDLSPYEYKDELIESGVDENVFNLLEKTKKLDEYATFLIDKVSWDDFKKYREVEEHDIDDDLCHYTEVNGKFYTLD